MGIFSPETVSVGDLFTGALIPGLLLVGLYILYVLFTAWLRPERAPALPAEERRYHGRELAIRVLRVLVPPLLLIVLVLGSIMAGAATPTEAASMVFLILIGASLFSLVFRGFGGDDLVRDLLTDLPGGKVGALLVVMLVMFLLGFILDFIEITFVVVPIVAPILLMMDISPVWLGVMIAINLQTSFLTPPFGFALFYLRGVAPKTVATADIYRGVMPFIAAPNRPSPASITPARRPAPITAPPAARRCSPPATSTTPAAAGPATGNRCPRTP